MRLRDRVAGWISGRRPVGILAPLEEPMLDLELRRSEASTAIAAREALTISPVAGMIDTDDYQFRRLSSGQRFKQRDLNPMAQDRMLEIAWYLYETNPFARRLITCMTDLVVGEGVGFEATDEKIKEAAGKVWNHPINKLSERARELHNALALNGELILPVMVNDVSGVPTIGFIDPYQVDAVECRADNVLVPEFVRLKKNPDDADFKRIKIVQQDPLTGKLDGECFYFAINKLPNSSRGRSDFLPLGDWLDLFDQYMFANVERVRLLSAFVWDLEIKDADAKKIQERVGEIGTPQSGSVFAHNQNEKLEAQSPTLSASDHTETARLLTIHIVGSLGMPISWFGWTDSNNATIQGQNDVAMKTPAARQKEFGHFLNQILRFGIEKQRGANAVLFKQIENDQFGVSMPEIAAKDISRVAAALGSIVAAMDSAMQNRTMSRRVATTLQLALTKHLGSGFDFKADEVMAEADGDAEERQQRQDDLMANAGAMAAAAGGGAGETGRGNPAVPGGPGINRRPGGGGQPKPPKEGELDWIGPGADQFTERLEDLEDALEVARRTPATIVNVQPATHVHPSTSISVPNPTLIETERHDHQHAHHKHEHFGKGRVARVIEQDTDPKSPTFGQVLAIVETLEDGSKIRKTYHYDSDRDSAGFGNLLRVDEAPEAAK